MGKHLFGRKSFFLTGLNFHDMEDFSWPGRLSLIGNTFPVSENFRRGMFPCIWAVGKPFISSWDSFQFKIKWCAGASLRKLFPIFPEIINFSQMVYLGIKRNIHPWAWLAQLSPSLLFLLSVMMQHIRKALQKKKKEPKEEQDVLRNVPQPIWIYKQVSHVEKRNKIQDGRKQSLGVNCIVMIFTLGWL